MEYTTIEKTLTIKEAIKKRDIIVDHDISDIKEVISKNCYRYSKNKTARVYMVLIDGSEASRRAFNRIINCCNRKDLLILLCIRLITASMKKDLERRWFIKYTAVTILEKYNDILKNIGQNNSIIYPESKLKLLDCIVAWANKENVTHLVLGGSSWSFRRRLAKRCPGLYILNY